MIVNIFNLVVMVVVIVLVFGGIAMAIKWLIDEWNSF
jgi:hypothetical protein